jgi:oligopeptide transport system ATP-binding protein
VTASTVPAAAAPVPAETGALLTARGLHVTFGVGGSIIARLRHEERLLRAVDGVDLEIRRGEALALVGESGSGKSTLARALTGLIQPDKGVIALQGKVLPARRSRSDQRRIQMVFQDPYSSLNPRMTVASMLAELLRVHHVVPRGEVESFSRELLGLVGLGEEALSAYPRQFSGGQRQRVAIARALVCDPAVLICDEVTSALDVSVQAAIVELLGSLQRDLGLSMLFITHNLPLVRSIAQRVAVLSQGSIVELGDVGQVLSDPGQPYTRQLLSDTPSLELAIADVGLGEPPADASGR